MSPAITCISYKFKEGRIFEIDVVRKFKQANKLSIKNIKDIKMVEGNKEHSYEIKIVKEIFNQLIC